jgi:hypothetical protein
LFYHKNSNKWNKYKGFSEKLFNGRENNVSRLALSGVAPTPSHYKYNKTFHSAVDFP